VQVQIEDGELAKVELLDRNGRISGSLKGTEQIIISNQEELTEGQPIEAVPSDAKSKNDAPQEGK
jgi:hypothetical protein